MMANGLETNGSRFGCGFIFGVVLGLLSLLGMTYLLGFAELFIVLGVAVICGFAAMKFGNRFWQWIARWGP